MTVRTRRPPGPCRKPPCRSHRPRPRRRGPFRRPFPRTPRGRRGWRPTPRRASRPEWRAEWVQDERRGDHERRRDRVFMFSRGETEDRVWLQPPARRTQRPWGSAATSHPPPWYPGAVGAGDIPSSPLKAARTAVGRSTPEPTACPCVPRPPTVVDGSSPNCAALRVPSIQRRPGDPSTPLNPTVRRRSGPEVPARIPGVSVHSPRGSPRVAPPPDRPLPTAWRHAGPAGGCPAVHAPRTSAPG